jgi:hypothetical protein
MTELRQTTPLRGVAGITRQRCPKCDDLEALIARGVCCSCGADLSKSQKRARRRLSWNNGGGTSKGTALTTPIVDTGENLLTLMRAKA